ncbi:hypothetical protein Syun_007240 [Stephania yunnanensis]|uniref:Uncharacterized protein n=1 Tax=Stephania yunnanensis TaxID=152371 RepID=A0AAP0Q043_9MAGN
MADWRGVTAVACEHHRRPTGRALRCCREWSSRKSLTPDEAERRGGEAAQSVRPRPHKRCRGGDRRARDGESWRERQIPRLANARRRELKGEAYPDGGEWRPANAKQPELEGEANPAIGERETARAGGRGRSRWWRLASARRLELEGDNVCLFECSVFTVFVACFSV